MNKTDRHHIVPRSRKGSNRPENIVRLDIYKHRALHCLFDNQTPPEQIRRLLSINETALTDEVKNDVMKILNNLERDYWYKKNILKK